MHPSVSNIGGYIKLVPSMNIEVLAGGAGGAGVTADNTATDGTRMDRYNPGGASGAGNASVGTIQSAVLFVQATATLAAGKKVTVIVNLKETTDAYASLANAQQPGGDTTTACLTITDGGAGGTSSGSKEFDLDLSGNKRYIRPTVTVDLNAANTDICQCAVGFIAGQTVYPV
jgi:hypothetical protein